jgi:opacity protein-like surface antigen
MKKIVFVLFMAFFTISSYAQVGDLTVGATGGYVTQYKDGMYGLNLSYHLSDPLEVSFTGLMNPNITLTDEFNKNIKEKLNVYSLNLDLRYYMLLMQDWGTGPALGYQYLIVKDKSSNSLALGDFNASGFNIGWHARFNITDNLKIMGGWRYTMASEEARHHFIYLGIGYTFNLF